MRRGLAFCLVLFFYVAPRVFEHGWFERAVFSWGWATETTRSSTAKILPPPTTTSDATSTTRTRQAQLPPEPPPTRGRLAAVRGGHLLFNRR